MITSKTFTDYFAALAHAHEVDATLARAGLGDGTPVDLYRDQYGRWVVSHFTPWG